MMQLGYDLRLLAITGELPTSGMSEPSPTCHDLYTRMMARINEDVMSNIKPYATIKTENPASFEKETSNDPKINDSSPQKGFSKNFVNTAPVSSPFSLNVKKCASGSESNVGSLDEVDSFEAIETKSINVGDHHKMMSESSNGSQKSQKNLDDSFWAISKKNKALFKELKHKYGGKFQEVSSFCEAKEIFEKMKDCNKFDAIFVSRETYAELKNEVSKFIAQNDIDGYERYIKHEQIQDYDYGVEHLVDVLKVHYCNPDLWVNNNKNSIIIKDSPIVLEVLISVNYIDRDE